MFTLFTRNNIDENESYDVCYSVQYSKYLKSDFPPTRVIGTFDTKEELVDLILNDRNAFKLPHYKNYFNSIIEKLENKIAYLIDHMDD